LEPLENRRVMSVKFVLSEAVLNITGTDADDKVELHEMRSNPASPVADLLQFSWKDNQGKSGKWEGKAATLSKIVFKGNGGDDVLKSATNPNGLPCFQYGSMNVYSLLPPIEAYGGPGKDILYGGPRDDKLYGDGGDDTLYGNYGADTLDGGLGTDALYGGPGDDHYDFNNKSVGGVLLDFDTVTEFANEGRDQLDFYKQMNRPVQLLLWFDQPQKVNEFLKLKLSSGAVIEDVQGTLYDDVIAGNDLNNDIYASDGNDVLYGFGGDDTLDGGAGDDTLYGGIGTDTLKGGPNNDALFGGPGSDTLLGGTEADRFLKQEDFGLDSNPPIQDKVMDPAPEDAIITFKTGNKGWTEAEIQSVDEAFAILHKATKNTKLLKTGANADIQFVRTSVIPSSDATKVILGDNDDKGTIRITDAGLDNSLVVGNVLHEIGHNWDYENPRWSDFINLSGWTTAYQTSGAFTVTVGHKNVLWWYKTSSTFASGYAKVDPVEDFAESFAASFLQRAGLSWYKPNDGLGAIAIPAKVNLINTWVASITSA
jgi:hypothetical protein